MTTILLAILSAAAVFMVFLLGVKIGLHLYRMQIKFDSFVGATKELMRRTPPTPPKPEKPQAVIVDPSDPTQRAKFERDEMFKQLNNS
jgi:hypothetical protein